MNPEKTADPDHPAPEEPPLHQAARFGNCDAIKRLVAQGANLEEAFNLCQDPGQEAQLATPLMIAAGSGEGASVETVRTLLDLGANPAARTDRSAATYACTGLGWGYPPGGDAARLQLLLESGSPLPENSPAGKNHVLCEVAKAGDPERLAILLGKGFNARGHFDPEHARKQELHMQEMSAKYRATRPELFPAPPPGIQESMAASQTKRDHEELARAIAAPWHSEIPLFCAAESGSAECVQHLLASGSDPATRDRESRTAMYYATTHDAIRVLAQAGVPLQDSDEYGWNPLDDAVADREAGLPRVRALIQAGANVNASHDRGYTVFMMAVSFAPMETLMTLVAAGSNVHAVSELGHNAFHALIDSRNSAALLGEKSAYLKQLGVEVEHRTIHNRTPLARAVDEGSAEEVAALCEVGANPNAICPARRCKGGTCRLEDLPILFEAADGSGVRPHLKTELLLSAGADPFVQDSEGHTPFIHVLARLCQDSEDYKGQFAAFFDGLEKVPAPTAFGGCDDFIAAAKPILRQYVEQFAAAIPVPKTTKYDAEYREERISMIVSFCAYEGWIRTQEASKEG